MKRWKVYVNFYARYLLLIWSKVICIVSAQNNASTNQVFYCLKERMDTHFDTESRNYLCHPVAYKY